MALVACAACRQPFYASCHDNTCIDALCPYCEYEDAAAARDVLPGDAPDATPSVSVAALASVAEAQARAGMAEAQPVGA